MVYTLRFFSSSKYSLFHNSNDLVPVLLTFYIKSVLNFEKNNSGAKRLKALNWWMTGGTRAKLGAKERDRQTYRPSFVKHANWQPSATLTDAFFRVFSPSVVKQMPG
jgi:hypothetical protein